MIDKARAREIAFQSAQKGLDVPIAIQDDRTIEEGFGWVFFYQAANPPHQIFGNAPIIVDRGSGKATDTGTGFPIEWYVAAYKALGEERYRAEWLAFVRTNYLSEDDDEDDDDDHRAGD